MVWLNLALFLEMFLFGPGRDLGFRGNSGGCLYALVECRECIGYFEQVE